MSIRQKFIDRTARKPAGRRAVNGYADPKGHYKSFRIIGERLSLKKSDRYLEIGCGGGVLLKQALEKADKASAIDHSEDMVALASESNYGAIEDGRLEVLLGDAGSLPWDDHSFTACACANVFFFIDKPVAVLCEICRVLKPGGRFCMTTMSDSFWGKISFGLLYSLRTYSDEKMASMFRKAGFSQIEIYRDSAIQQVCYAVK